MKQRRRKTKKQETFFQKLINWTFTLLLACGLGVQVCNASNSNLKFAQVSDAHYSSFESDTSYKVLSSSPKILDDVIMQINETPSVNFVMFTGDLVNKPKTSQLLEFINKANCLKAPWYGLLGNHDVQEFKMSKSEFFDILCGHNPNFSYKGPYYSFSPKKGYKVICLDTIILNRVTTQGEIYPEELEWLDSELKNAKNDVVIICTHVPIVEPYNSESHRLTNRLEIMELLHKYKNPIIVCSGHYHGSKIIQEDNVLYIDTPSLVTYPCAFRIININNQKKKVVVDVYTKQTRLKDTLNTAKVKVMGASFLAGNPEDQNNTFEIKK